jgi:hypothetical protein
MSLLDSVKQALRIDKPQDKKLPELQTDRAISDSVVLLGENFTLPEIREMLYDMDGRVEKGRFRYNMYDGAYRSLAKSLADTYSYSPVSGFMDIEYATEPLPAANHVNALANFLRINGFEIPDSILLQEAENANATYNNKSSLWGSDDSIVYSYPNGDFFLKRPDRSFVIQKTTKNKNIASTEGMYFDLSGLFKVHVPLTSHVEEGDRYIIRQRAVVDGIPAIKLSEDDRVNCFLKDTDMLFRAALMDYILGNDRRDGNNYLFDYHNYLWLVDNGFDSQELSGHIVHSPVSNSPLVKYWNRLERIVPNPDDIDIPHGVIWDYSLPVGMCARADYINRYWEATRSFKFPETENSLMWTQLRAEAMKHHD